MISRVFPQPGKLEDSPHFLETHTGGFDEDQLELPGPN